MDNPGGAGYLPYHKRKDGRATFRLWRISQDARCVFIFAVFNYMKHEKSATYPDL